jgi:Pilus formation protein N terminal region
MTAISRIFGLAVLPGLAATFVPALALAEEISVSADHSQVISLDRTPGTVVVGNPTIADVTMQGNLLFVHGRVFGKTNIIVLDENGNQLGDYDINVTLEDSYNVVVFKPGVRESYTCRRDCESVLHVGDSGEYYKLASEQQKAKLSLGQGQKAGENSSDNGGQQPPAQ